MAYYIRDATGRTLGHIASIEQLKDMAGDALSEFLQVGEADDVLAEEIRNEIDGVAELKFLQQILNGHAPFILKGDEDEDSD